MTACLPHRGGTRSPFAELEPVRVQLPNAIELHHVRAGEGASLVFVHGAMGDWRSWEPQWEPFTARFDCVSYSRRFSHPNRNECVAPDHSALHDAEDLRLLLDALGIEHAVLVGSSYGAFAALALACSHPDRVRALVAVEPPMMKYADFSAAGRAAATAFRAEVAEPAQAAFRAGEDERAARLMTGGIHGAATHTITPHAMARRLQNVRAMKALALSSDEFPLLAPQALAALPMPVLLVSGAATPAIHREVFENIAAAMPQARRARIAGAGHGVARDQPHAFNTTALDFLNPVPR